MPVETIPGAVKDDPYDWPILHAIRQAGCEVRMVVLHRQQSQPVACQLQTIARGRVLGMHVNGDGLWLDTKEPAIQGYGRLVVVLCLQVLQVADVLAQEGVAIARQAKGIL